ncbi:MAG: hypothetical protein Kow0010_15730 [Dehalococcoidia bacterium]
MDEPGDAGPAIGAVRQEEPPPAVSGGSRRYSRRKLLGLAGAAAAAGVAGGWLLTRETRQLPALPETATPTATATFRIFPTPTPMPTPVPLDPASEIVPVGEPAPFTHATFEPNAPIQQEHGAFFMDTATCAVEAWWIAGPQGQEPLFYRLLAGGRFVLARTIDDTEFLLDRVTGRTFAWTRDRMELIAANPSHLLVAETRRPSANQSPLRTGTLFLAAFTGREVGPVNRYLLEEAPDPGWSVDARFSPDGEHLVLLSGFRRGPRMAHHIGLGSFRETARIEIAPWARFNDAGPGDLVQFEGYVDPGKDPGQGTMIILRRTWDLADGPPAVQSPATSGIDVAPGGDRLALRTWQRYAAIEMLGEAADQWGALAFADAGGEPLFRVRSAFMDYGDGIRESRWLADGSGYVAMVREDAPPPEIPPWAAGWYAIVRSDGSGIDPFPEPPAEIRGRLTGWRGSPIPAPGRPDLFSLGRTALFNRSTGEWFAPELPFSHRGHENPWGDSSDEMMFVLDAGGHDGGWPPVMLPPRIERPPYDDRLVFRVSVDTWLNLRAEPSLAGEIVDTLADGTIVEHASPDANESQVQGDWEANILWLHVRKTDGTTGWVDASYLEWA